MHIAALAGNQTFTNPNQGSLERCQRPPYKTRGRFFLALLAASFLTACGGDSGSSTFVVTLNANGGTAGSTTQVNVDDGGTVPSSTSGLPTRSAYVLNGWNTKVDGSGSAFVFGSTVVNANLTLYAQWTTPLTLADVLGATNPVVPNNLSLYDEMAHAVLAPYPAGAALVVRYASPNGGATTTSPTTITAATSFNGESWDKAWGAPDLKNLTTKITDAADKKVYLLLLKAGEYRAGAEFAMMNNVAIVGGWSGTAFSRSGTATLSGAGSHRVIFNNKNSLTTKALLYGVTITKGKAGQGAGMTNIESSPTLTQVAFTGNEGAQFGGGGMANYSASPVLTQVTFTDNLAGHGAGMYNYQSSPTLTQVSFTENEGGNGGGMYNDESAPTLTQVTFKGNSGSHGGGMFNNASSPILAQVSFEGNWVGGNGGGMYNAAASPTLIQVTFKGNWARAGGGGMFNDNDGAAGPTIVNSIFWGSSPGSAMAFRKEASGGTGDEPISLYNSIVEGGLPSGVASGTAFTGSGGGIDATTDGTKVVITFSGLVDAGSTSPLVSTGLADNGGTVQTIALTPSTTNPAYTNPAINAGLYVKKSGTSYYSSSNGTTWYSGLSGSGTTATPPADAIELTATDARGYARVGRPDLGAYEFGGTAP